jgi:hypothetical protein
MRRGRIRDLSTFFDPPPPPQTPELTDAARQPAWVAPPANVLGHLVADRTVVWRSPSLVLSFDHLRAYPEGFEFRVGVRSRHSLHPTPELGILAHGVQFSGRQLRVVEHGLRLGLEFADAVRLTNLSPIVGAGLDGPPEPPLLVRRGGGGFGGRWDEHYWVWGLPPEGPLTVVLESPAHDVPATSVTLDGSAVREAAQRAETLWEAPAPTTSDSPWTLGMGMGMTFAPEPQPTEAGPADLEAAQAAVSRAFAAMQHVQEGALVNVEGGEDLGTVLSELGQRFGPAQAATHTVERVVFVGPTEAAVWFSVWLGAHPFLSGQRGTAILDDGRWKVSRATLCGLLARAGIRCPPRRP